MHAPGGRLAWTLATVGATTLPCSAALADPAAPAAPLPSGPGRQGSEPDTGEAIRQVQRQVQADESVQRTRLERMRDAYRAEMERRQTPTNPAGTAPSATSPTTTQDSVPPLEHTSEPTARGRRDDSASAAPDEERVDPTDSVDPRPARGARPDSARWLWRALAVALLVAIAIALLVARAGRNTRS